ncbi:ABC transporter substrate-binding protein [Bdellovibrio sp. SKB1291214]|uniref:ABC transporter substrate-binding protein n=1 Tax=Bdellovibrio sp. SKB1291214 TaxID=1732569 RepID=UPI000B51BE5A|nr:ABC transporter substrate-binding protein [Bdellovibrio sp. SKB1291214]UYL08155.1 ABC transporter substrate-binding protein [Bdellovibrio sp. SKB1291214]
MKSVLITAMFFVCSLGFAAEPVNKPAVSVSLALNWKPEPEFGGFYEAAFSGTYLKHGINIDIQEGGSGTPTVQMLANGKVDFAIVSADEIIISQDRNPKNKVVALFAVYQTAPYIIMSHAESDFKTVKDVFANETTLAVQAGLPYYQYLVKKFGKPKANVVPYVGGVASFLNDKKFSQQGFITTEPLAAEKGGAKVKNFLIADEGFNPYVVVVAAREEMVKKNPELVSKMIEATRAGWENYLKDPTRANKGMAKMNRALDFETFQKAAQIQKPLIEVKGQVLGSMTAERWETLVKQMKELKQIKSTPAAKDLFRP